MINPSADPDDVSGRVDPSIATAALIERNPATCDVVCDNRGRFKFFENPDDTLRMFTMDELPSGQVEAYRVWNERMNAAQAGDRAAQAHLENEQRNTDDATGRPSP